MVKVNSKGLFIVLHCSSVSILDFEQVIFDWIIEAMNITLR